MSVDVRNLNFFIDATSYQATLKLGKCWTPAEVVCEATSRPQQVPPNGRCIFSSIAACARPASWGSQRCSVRTTIYIYDFYIYIYCDHMCHGRSTKRF